jgi:hypothetical protein
VDRSQASDERIAKDPGGRHDAAGLDRLAEQFDSE